MWAVQMYDAGVHSVGGVITADTYQLGHFDECLNVSYPAYNVKGKYCLVTLKFGPAYNAYKNYYSPPAPAYFQDPPPDSIVWDKIKTTLDPRMKIRNEIHLGVCVPSSCSYSDVQNSLNRTVSHRFSNHNLYGEIYLDKSMCYTKDDDKYDVGFYIMQSILILLILIASLATVYDYFLKPSDRHEVSTIILTDKVYNGNGINIKVEEENKPSKLADSLMAFSMRANVNELVSDGVDKSLDILNGAKFVCLAVIILGHRTLYTLGSALYNPEYWEESVINFKHMSFMNGTQVVDTFFLIGGFLAFQGVYHQLQKTSRFNLPLLVFFRWLRIMPSYIVIMGVYALLLIHLGSGPLWNKKIGVESENCQETWWLNVLFINNYVAPEKQCLLMSWYLACDMHFFIIGACIIYLLWRLPKFANIILGVSLAISLITPFIHVYLGSHDGKLKLYQKLLQQPYLDKEFTSVYVRSHSRSIPYLCGIIIGHICNQFKKAGYTIPRHINVAGISIFFIMYMVQVYSLVIYTPGRSYYPLENAIFSALLPLSWSIGSGWILLVQYTTGLGFYKWLFCQKIYAPLSRLSYCAVLIHPAVQVVHAAANVSSEYMVYPKLVWMSCGDITLTYLFALLLYLTVETPFKNLQKLWLMPDRKIVPKSLENNIKKNSEQNQEQNHHQTMTQDIPMAVTVKSDSDGCTFDRSNNSNSTNNR